MPMRPESMVYSFNAAMFELDSATHEWVLKHVDSDIVQIYLFMDNTSCFRMIGWIEDTGEVLIKNPLTAECIWLDVTESFAQFTTAKEFTFGLSFSDASVATEASNVMHKILDTLHILKNGNQKHAIKDMMQDLKQYFDYIQTNGVGALKEESNVDLLITTQIAAGDTNLQLENANSHVPSSAKDERIKTKRSSSVPQPSCSINNFELRRGSYPLAMAPHLPHIRRCSSPMSTTSSRGSRRQSLASPKPIALSYSSKILPEDERISRPYQTKQELHVTFNAELARYEGLPVAWRGLNKQFGLPIDAVPKRKVVGYEGKIPAVLQMMKDYLILHGGLDTEGIFRLAPDKEACNRVKDAMNNGNFTGCNDVHIVANLIKVWFRELPESLFNVFPEKLIYKVCSMNDPIQVLSILDDISSSQKNVILWLLDLMCLVVKNEKQTKMSAKNMAIVLSPNLFSIESDNPMVALTMSRQVAEFTTIILNARLHTAE
ncbi:hypothetical protein THRCLA_02008 [Thraustotheca clavata]|uniref:Rho-GAP domain-containing protein n=1 Tax=Thraustotheca clavata TaxID=74557 RepID=A0A1W0A6K8_9STRA|nr:hypothetical protein THRCLA_02008 [Thraustotheca clavata]